MRETIVTVRKRSILTRLFRAVAFVSLLLILAVAAAISSFRFISIERETLAAGRSGHKGSYVTADGLDLHYTSWGPETGKPLILIHGTLAWSETWYEIAGKLAGQGYHVLAPDLPPFGYSERPSDRDYSRKAQARRILAFADALGLTSFILAGHSFGGGDTLEAAFTAPQRIDGLVLLDVALGLDNPGDGTLPGRLFAIPVIGPALTASTFTNPMMTGKGLRDFIHDDTIVTETRISLYQRPQEIDGTSAAVADWLSGALFADERHSLAANPDNYRAFMRPVVIIWGRQDDVTPLAQGEHIRALLPRATLIVLDQVNHLPHVENPDAVAAIIQEFAAGLADKDTILPQAILRHSNGR